LFVVKDSACDVLSLFPCLLIFSLAVSNTFAASSVSQYPLFLKQKQKKQPVHTNLNSFSLLFPVVAATYLYNNGFVDKLFSNLHLELFRRSDAILEAFARLVSPASCFFETFEIS